MSFVLALGGVTPPLNLLRSVARWSSRYALYQRMWSIHS